MNKLILNSALGVLTLFPASGWAECTKNESIQAETNAATLSSWNDIYGAFKKFSHCDDGAIAEGYSESVSQMLANHWSELGNLEKKIKADKQFENFVLKHIDQTISQENGATILENAGRKCPKGSKRLCKRIQEAAKASSGG